MTEFSTVESDGFEVTADGTPAEVAAALGPPTREPAPTEPATPGPPGPEDGGQPDPTPEPTPDAAAGTEPATPESEAGRTLAAKRKTLEGRKQSIQSEIDALIAQKHTTKRETEAARAELEQLRAERAAIQREREALKARQPAKPTADEQPAGPVKPKLEDFETLEQYTEAVGEWSLARAQAALEQRFEAERQRIAEAEGQRAQQQLYAQHQTRVEQARVKHPDFDTVLAAQADMRTSPAIDAHIVSSDFGGELLYYLATHPDDCDRIAALPFGPALVALGRLEERLAAAPSGPARVVTTSTAKPPIKPVGSSPAPVTDEDPDDLPIEQHVKFYNRQDREARRRA